MEEENLTKGEKRAFRRAELGKERRKGGLKGFWVWLLVLAVVGLGGWWVWKKLTEPLPGQAVADMGRGHVTDISDVVYNSSPPTSGSHFPVWLKAGVYDRVVSDGYLIHSLEHGYVVISYDCTKSVSSFQFPVSSVYAHEAEEVHEEPFDDAQGKPFGIEQGRGTQDKPATGSAKPLTRSAAPPSATMSWFTPENPPAKEVELPESFISEGCKKLVSQLTEVSRVEKRVVVVPRLGMEKPIALTAWARIHYLDRFDRGEIERFVKAWHNRGPEKTVE